MAEIRTCRPFTMQEIDAVSVEQVIALIGGRSPGTGWCNPVTAFYRFRGSSILRLDWRLIGGRCV